MDGNLLAQGGGLFFGGNFAPPAFHSSCVVVRHFRFSLPFRLAAEQGFFVLHRMGRDECGRVVFINI